MAAFKNQRTVSHKQSSVRFWAVVISVVVHLIVLAVFGVVTFSQLETQDKQSPVPTAKVDQVKRFLAGAAVIPKPRIRRTNERLFIEKPNRKPTTNQILYTTKPGPQNLDDLVKSVSSTSPSLSAGKVVSPRGIEFFGSRTQERKVCYVVDCSGSMQGIFGRVREKLTESIKDLQADQYFYIIFFGNDRLFEFGDGRLVRATEQSKSAAYKFIDTVQPVGRTNASVALEKAVQVCDSRGLSPAVIYFLTDGFELTNEDTQKFLQRVTNLLKQFAPSTKINTIGFWPQDEDRRMLELIAGQSGGEFVFVRD